MVFSNQFPVFRIKSVHIKIWEEDIADVGMTFSNQLIMHSRLLARSNCAPFHFGMHHNQFHCNLTFHLRSLFLSLSISFANRQRIHLHIHHAYAKIPKTAKEEERIMFQQMQAFAQKQVNTVFHSVCLLFLFVASAVFLPLSWHTYSTSSIKYTKYLYVYFPATPSTHRSVIHIIFFTKILTISLSFCLDLRNDLYSFFLSNVMLCHSLHLKRI